MKKKAIVGSLLCLTMLLTGCSKSSANHAKTEPMSSDSDVVNAFSKDGQDLIKKTDDLQDISQMSSGYWGIGEPLPDFDTTTYDGKTINIAKEYKGKKVVIEFMAYWCSFCKNEEQEYIDKIRKDNPDIEFLQVFTDGSKEYKTDSNSDETKDVISEFYRDAGHDSVPTDYPVIQENHDIIQYAGNVVHLKMFPSFYFYDETGKAAWYHEGVMTEEQFNTVKGMAFGISNDKKLYNLLSNGLTKANEAYRTWQDVKNDIPEAQQKKISALPLNKDSGEQAYYSNIYRPVNVTTKMVDILRNNVIDVTSSKGKTVYLLVNVADTDLSNQISAINQYSKVTKCENLVIVLFGNDNNTSTDDDSEKQVISIPKTDCNIINASSLPEDLNEIRVMGEPEVIYVDEVSKKCMGAYYGSFTLETLQKAEDAIISFNIN